MDALQRTSSDLWAVLFDEMMWCQWNARVQHFNITYKLGGAETSSEYFVSNLTHAGALSLHIIDLQYLYYYCCTDKEIQLGYLQMLPEDIN